MYTGKIKFIQDIIHYSSTTIFKYKHDEYVVMFFRKGANRRAVEATDFELWSSVTVCDNFWQL